MTEQDRGTGARHEAPDVRAFFELATDPLCVIDADGTIHDANPAFARAFEGPETTGDATGSSFFAIVHADQRPAARDALARARVGEPGEAFVARCRFADGSWRSCSWTLSTSQDTSWVYAAARAVAALAADGTDVPDEHYRHMFASIDRGFAFCEAVRDDRGAIVDFAFREVNPAFTRITGFSPDTAIGHTIRALTPTVNRASVIRLARVVETGEPETIEDDIEEMGQWFRVSAFPLEGDRFAVIFSDTTERRRIRQERERLLREVEAERARLVQVIDQAPSLMAVMRGPDHIYEHANAFWHELLGTSNLVGKLNREVVTASEWQGLFEMLDQVYATGEPFVGTDIPVRFTRPVSGTIVERTIDVVYQPLREADGTISGVIAQAVDQTERANRLRAEADLLASEARYRTLFETMDEGFCTIEVLLDDGGTAVDYRFVEVNPAFERHTGLRDAVGKRVLELIPGLESYWIEIFGRVARTGEPVRFIQEAHALDNRWFEVDAFRIEDDGHTRVAILFTDITERKHAEEARERALRETQEAVRARDVFLSIASHELRNPVASIKASAQLLRRSHLAGRLDDERIVRYTETLVGASDRLIVLLNDLLDVSRLQSGHLTLHPTATDLAELMRDTIDTQRVMNRGRRLRLDLEDGAALPIDRERFRQVITNLVDNAVKYSPEGGEIVCSLADGDDGVLLRVRDEGIGLPASTLESIFQPFGRASNAAESNIPGMGLGLFISRRIVEGHGGRLWAESAGEGQGTTFCLWLSRVPDGAATPVSASLTPEPSPERA